MIAALYHTRFGKAYCTDSIQVLREIPSASVQLVLTSPPFALRRKKSYGNVSADKYCGWFWPFAQEIARILKPKGSFVLDIGGSWNKGEPTRTLYHFELLMRLCSKEGWFQLAQEFYWFNPAKMPAPAQWVTIERVRVKDSVNPIWWLSKSATPNASNRRVLKPYTESMKKLLSRGYNEGPRPSGHIVSNKWGRKQRGAIPPNLIIAANTSSTDPYLRACREHALEVHPARFVPLVPQFFIKFLTRPGDVVVDPFSGSGVVAHAAESLGRKWICSEINPEYVLGSAFRFGKIGDRTYRKHKKLLAQGVCVP
jgi:site-specific DNA-methyltransferase (cytosine-N4-specific)